MVRHLRQSLTERGSLGRRTWTTGVGATESCLIPQWQHRVLSWTPSGRRGLGRTGGVDSTFGFGRVSRIWAVLMLWPSDVCAEWRGAG